METPKKGVLNLVGADFLERLGEDSWTYIKTVVDIVREPVLILDKDLRVMAANEPFYQMFQVESHDTEGEVVYKLGNGQWNIPTLRKLLEDILPKHTFFKGFEVDHQFPSIGRKVMILNARQIYCKEDITREPCPPIILLAVEDITEMMDIADTLAGHGNQIAAKLMERTQKLEVKIGELEKEIEGLKKES
ncbi:MAG: PAS domain-containing protein [bacterium]|nr:PAS domain-containing protein [bacterium]